MVAEDEAAELREEVEGVGPTTSNGVVVREGRGVGGANSKVVDKRD